MELLEFQIQENTLKIKKFWEETKISSGSQV